MNKYFSSDLFLHKKNSSSSISSYLSMLFWYICWKEICKIPGMVSSADILYNFNGNWYKLDEEYSPEIAILNPKYSLQLVYS